MTFSNFFSNQSLKANQQVKEMSNLLKSELVAINALIRNPNQQFYCYGDTEHQLGKMEV